MDPCYLDYNATTPLHPVVADRLGQFLAENRSGNPSSLHTHGRQARKVIEDARDKLAFFLGVDQAEVFFTSGGTESNNLIIQGLSPLESPLHVGATEHPSVLEPARSQWKAGRPGGILPVDGNGRIDQLDAIDGGLVSIQWVNNETGIVQDLAQLSHEIHQRNGILHSDGAQGFFRIPNVIPDLGIDAASITAHKSFGPPGVGALWLRKGLLIDPVLQGGPQEKKVRPGTENLLAIHAFGLLADVALHQPLWQLDSLREARLGLLEGLSDVPDCQVIEQQEDDWPGCINVGFKGIHAETLLVRLDMIGISASSGSACSSGARELSHVLEAMQIELGRIRGSIRISIGPENSAQQLREIGLQIASIVADLRHS
ncbi:MAG: cysteine desulfurase [Planctomycetes bacterium]|nr:cysteine desulfurase [Planctomycetota bacterium]